MTPLSSSGRPSSKDALVWSAIFTLAAVAGTSAAVAGVVGDGLLGASFAGLGTGAAVLLLALLALLRRRQRAHRTELARREQEVERLTIEHRRQAAQRETQWRDQADARSAALRESLEHLLRVRIPAVVAGSPVPSAPSDSRLDDATSSLLAAVLAEMTDGLKRADEREETLRLAVVALSRRVQTAAHSIQEQVSLMAERHQHAPDVVEASMRVDHAAAQQARHAQSLAVLCGEWPGQQWQEPLAMVDVVRAASARILAYQRVEVSGDQDVAVAAEVVEPVVHLVAELLANATQSSPPATRVPVTVRRVQRGAVIEIDDGGVGMDEHRLQQAREIVSGRRPVGLGELGEIPQTGLAIVGHYVRRHGFRADLSESPYGGLRAVVLIPARAMETLDPPEAIAARRAPNDPRPAPLTPAGVAEPDSTVQTGVSRLPVTAPPASAEGLPRRHSRRGQAGSTEPAQAWTTAPTPAGNPESTGEPVPTPEQAGAWMGAFIKGGRTGGGSDPADTSTASTTPEDEEG